MLFNQTFKRVTYTTLFLTLIGISLWVIGYRSNNKNFVQTFQDYSFYGMSTLVCFSLGCCLIDLSTHIAKVKRNIFIEYLYQHNSYLIAFEVLVCGFFKPSPLLVFAFFCPPYIVRGGDIKSENLVNNTKYFIVRLLTYGIGLLYIYTAIEFLDSKFYSLTLPFIITQSLLFSSAFIAMVTGFLSLSVSERKINNSDNIEFLGKQLLFLTFVSALCFSRYMNSISDINFDDIGQVGYFGQCVFPGLVLLALPGLRTTPKGLILIGAWIFLFSFITIYGYTVPILNRTTIRKEELGIFLTLFMGTKFLFLLPLYLKIKSEKNIILLS